MADPYNPSLMPRTYFRAPSVPFDFRALLFGVLGYLVWWGGDWLLSTIFDMPSLTGAFLETGLRLFYEIPFLGGAIAQMFAGVFHLNLGEIARADFTFWHKLVGGIWFLSVWSFFSLGIARITALRLSRDEGMSIGETIRFSLKHWTSLLWVPLIVGGIIAVFTGANALAGLVISIPFVGSILSLVLLPLAALSTLLILLVALGGIVGFPLIASAAAWEVNGSLDAVSRAFSYVFARPLQYFWSYFLILLFTGVILLVGGWFTSTLVNTVDLGVVSDNLEVLTAAPAVSTDENSQYAEYKNNETRTLLGDLATATGYRPGLDAPDAKPFAKDIVTVAKADWSHKLTALVWWGLLNLAWLLFLGYAVYYLIGASASVYADLREDVDGTEPDEIFLEEPDADLDALVEGGPTTEAAAAEAPSTGEAKSADAPAADAPASDAPKADGDDTPA